MIPVTLVAGILSQGWREYLAQPFARDTLARLLSKRVIVSSAPRPPLGMPQLRAVTLPFGLPAADTNAMEIRVFQHSVDEALFIHEMGHAVDYQGMAPEVADSVRALMPSRFRYAGRVCREDGCRAEYVAETFAAALQAVRAGRSPDDRRFPGAALWAAWIQGMLQDARLASQQK